VSERMEASCHPLSPLGSSQRSGPCSGDSDMDTSKSKSGSWGQPHDKRSGRRRPNLTPAAQRCRRKFLHFFPDGYQDETYIDWERDYKWSAHVRWMTELDHGTFKGLGTEEENDEIARRAVAIESRTNLLFSFEKMALRDAVRPVESARSLARGFFDFLHKMAL